MERTATAWLALSSADLGSGAFAVGLVLAVRMLPMLVLGLAAGTIADQTDRPRQLVIVAAAGLCSMALFVWLVVSSEAIQVWPVLTISPVAGYVSVLRAGRRRLRPPAASRCYARSSLRAPFRGDPPLDGLARPVEASHTTGRFSHRLGTDAVSHW